ncbi:hypothetical protein SRHO_G00261520 [Serrasalmus rhombeus]
MALVTLQRSPTPSAASTASTSTTNAGDATDFGSDDERRLNQSTYCAKLMNNSFRIWGQRKRKSVADSAGQSLQLQRSLLRK